MSWLIWVYDEMTLLYQSGYILVWSFYILFDLSSLSVMPWICASCGTIIPIMRDVFCIHHWWLEWVVYISTCFFFFGLKKEVYISICEFPACHSIRWPVGTYGMNDICMIRMIIVPNPIYACTSLPKPPGRVSQSEINELFKRSIWAQWRPILSLLYNKGWS